MNIDFTTVRGPNGKKVLSPQANYMRILPHYECPLCGCRIYTLGPIPEDRRCAECFTDYEIIYASSRIFRYPEIRPVSNEKRYWP